MGVEVQFYVMPGSSLFRPDEPALRALITDLTISGYVADPTPDNHVRLHVSTKDRRTRVALASIEEIFPMFTAEDMCIRWTIPDLKDSGLRYPLSETAFDEGVYYELTLELSKKTIYRTSEVIDPIENLQCSCGHALAETESVDRDVFNALRLPSTCDACGGAVEYARHAGVYRDPMTGKQCPLMGGVTYRCAVVVDCGKCWERTAVVTPSFQSVLEKHFGGPPRVVLDVC
ncbi:MAG: hypothetical protein IPK22_27860 [Verrucomicrobiaceae bacterium]|nr:hypothetical protein [Verrucomicrobiaceae bacterium]